MTPKRFMLIAGEASGDMLAAELVGELRTALARRNTYSSNVQPLEADLAPRFFGAGGAKMAAAGVEMSVNLAQHSMLGVPGVKALIKFIRFRNELLAVARERQPHAIICVDFNTFNLNFAAMLRKQLRARRLFNNWEPKIIKYISPQVWASRPGRAKKMQRDFDLLLSIFPFEKAWYAERVPNFRVEFVGHPMIDRHAADPEHQNTSARQAPLMLLLPGSRAAELRRHVPLLLDTLKIVRAAEPALRVRMVLPGPALVEQAKRFPLPPDVEVCQGDLAESLREASLALAKSGTVTMECAYFGVPTVAFYKASRLDYEIAKRVVKVNSIIMPNIIAGEPVFPEFIQDAATPENLARAALELLRDQGRREKVRAKLGEIIASLGQPGASRRAAEAILRMMP